ncbi:DUF2690 domain-containing protein [Streptomyces sp. NPDC094032]|uniref:DUF2690 domain-containing protein n=1 Tax=Streptomyces sp. NPDC094032 TaxID=3155308 RepID=UPI0033218902
MTSVVKRAQDEQERDAELRAVREQVLAGMRRIKEEFGLSYVRLAEKTHYSRSSWERFLNGKQWPRRAAIQQLAEVVGEDPTGLIELWERAEELVRESRRATERASGGGPERSGGPEPRPGDTASGPTPSSAPGRGRPLVHMAIGAVLGALTVIAVLGVNTAVGGPLRGVGIAPSGERTPGAAAQGPTVRASATVPDHPGPGCSGETCLGREPQTMNCQWDASTVRQLYLRGLRIQLRHSPACQAVWGRLENGAIGDGVIVTDKGSRTEEAAIRVDHDTYTRMLSVAEYPLSTISICGVIPKAEERECDPVQASPQP